MKRSPKSEKSGVALIMAVGFLAVLILLAVGFAVSMRVERLAARNYSDVVAARQFVRTGMTRAMTDLDARLQTDPLLATSQGVWPGAGAGTNEIISGWVTNYLPSHLVRRASLANASWMNVNSEVGGNLVGRFQYVVVDCSGLLDVNFDHSTNKFLGSGPRTTVTNSLDLWLETALVPDVASGQYGTLKDGRVANVGAMPAFTPWGRVETLAELSTYLGPAPGAGIFSSGPSNFFVYSRFPAGYEITPNSGNVTEALPIAASQAEWDLASTSQKTGSNLLLRIARQLELGYQQIPALSSQASELGYNLAYSLGDYCDSDDIPIEVTNSCTEATPLINEILFECELTQSATDYQLSIYPRVEVAFPFGGVTNNKSYFLRLICTFSGASPAQLNPSGAKVFDYTFTPQSGVWKWVSPSGMFQVTPVEGGPGAFSKLTMVAPITNTPQFASFQCKVTAVLVEGSAWNGAKRVDAVGFPVTSPLLVDLNFIALNNKRTGGKACNDPRHNAYLYQWVPVVEAGTKVPTLGPSKQGAFNDGVSQWTSVAPSTGEDLKWMYIANHRLSTPGEIGLLGFSPQYAWRTVDIIDTPAGASPYWLPVLDLFAMVTNQGPRFGLINLNSLQTNVIACAFNGVSPLPYPNANTDGNSTAPAQVSPTEALNIAGAYTSSRGANLARNVSGVRVLGLSSAWGAGWSLPEREAAVRNAANVLGSRDSTYTIVVRAQALSENGTLPVAEQTALAVVWRDRVPTRDRSGNLLNPSFVRYFRWITD